MISAFGCSFTSYFHHSLSISSCLFCFVFCDNRTPKQNNEKFENALFFIAGSLCAVQQRLQRVHFPAFSTRLPSLSFQHRRTSCIHSAYSGLCTYQCELKFLPHQRLKKGAFEFSKWVKIVNLNGFIANGCLYLFFVSFPCISPVFFRSCKRVCVGP